ncbi:hypothetical protein IE53DRAFT_309651, partial [Violaceomyces palustris]
GTAFSVANPAEFSRVVLPNWFKHSSWQSFVRQLNMYVRVPKGKSLLSRKGF